MPEPNRPASYPLATRPSGIERVPRRRGFFRWLLDPAFGKVAVEPEAVERLRRAYADGIVVHVLRSRRLIDPLYVTHLVERLGLGPPDWMHDHPASPLPSDAETLAAVVREGRPSLLFLRRPRTLASIASNHAEGHIEALIALQQQLDRPILLVPETLSWSRRAGGVRRTIIDVVFGDREAPGVMRELLGFLLRLDAARFHIGAPVNLQTVLERERGKPAPVVSKKIRWSILNHLAREAAIRSGPVHRPGARTRQLVLNDPTVQRLLAPKGEESAALDRERKETPAERRRRAEQIIKRMAADVRFGWLRVLDAIIDRVWNEIYDGIIVDEPGLRRVWAAARQGPVVLVPSHKSHADYLVLSQVFFKDGMLPPHIAAGDNLSFWPLGPIFRRGGAFFIRRSFAGDRLYSAICAAYVKRLLKDGYAVEFFIEGGRSRSGKLLQPKMGILSMTVDPVLDGVIQDVSFIPVSISYEKIIESKSYRRELEGGAKAKENVGALISTSKVLRSRYGRVYVDFEEPISLRAFAAARGVQIEPKSTLEDSTVEAPERRNLVGQLGHRIVYGINRVTRVTPTGAAALVLLAQVRRGMAEEELHRRAEWMINLLTDLGARLSSALAPETRKDALREALGRLAQDGLLQILPAPDGENVYRLEDPGRQALDFYKNNVVHFLVPLAIVATAVLAQDTSPAPIVAVRETARRLSRLLKFEFSFAVDSAFDQNFEAASAVLERHRVLERRETGLSVTLNGREHAEVLAGQIGVFLEAYRIATERAAKLSGPRAEKDLLTEILGAIKRAALEGRISRPEAASQLTAQNALRVLTDLEVVRRSDGGRFSPAPEASERATTLTQELQTYLVA